MAKSWSLPIRPSQTRSIELLVLKLVFACLPLFFSTYRGKVCRFLLVEGYVNVVTGSVGAMLTVCGYEKIRPNMMTLSALMASILNLLLMSSYKITDAVISSAFALMIQNVVARLWVWQKLRTRAFSFVDLERGVV